MEMRIDILDSGTYTPSMGRMLFWSLIIICLLERHCQAEEIVGFFKSISGAEGIVVAPDRSGYSPVEIVLDPKGRAEKLTLSGGWKLEGERPAALTGLPTSVRPQSIAVRTADGVFILPPFASEYSLPPGGKATIDHWDGQQVRAITLPIRGGSIRAFRVLRDGLDLLIYEQKSINVIDENGRRLFGVRRYGKNLMVRVTRRGAKKTRDVDSSDPRIYWVEGSSLFLADNKTKTLRPE